MLTITQKTVKGFVATDKMHPAMVGVHYNAGKKRLEMSNGPILACVDADLGFTENVILPVDAFPKTAGNVCTVDAAGKVTETHPKKGIVSRRIVPFIRERYPNVQALFDSMPDPEPTQAIAVNPSFFGPFYDLDKDCGGVGGVVLEFYGQTQAIKVSSTGFVGLLMPIRMPNKEG